MGRRIVHRGSDSEGVTVCGSVGLGMRRLNIIDLEGGRQPIFNEDHSMAIVFNGEIYNDRERRQDLPKRGHRFTTALDTEVILHLYEEYGERSVEKPRGMFAFAIHDRTTGRMFAARDRLGIKPLHYGETIDRLYLVSELKSLQAVPGMSLTHDEVALDQYFALLYIPASRTVFREAKKVPPGHALIKEQGRWVRHGIICGWKSATTLAPCQAVKYDIVCDRMKSRDGCLTGRIQSTNLMEWPGVKQSLLCTPGSLMCEFASRTDDFCGVEDEMVRARSDGIADGSPDCYGRTVGRGVELGLRRLSIRDLEGDGNSSSTKVAGWLPNSMQRSTTSVNSVKDLLKRGKRFSTCSHTQVALR
jgi:hypothetical protein